jgi:hypothetical protein
MVIRPAALLAITLAHSPAAQAQETLPRLSELEEGWNPLAPGGRTSCAGATDYRFFVRPGASDRILVYFMGGGACRNGRDCEQGRPLFQPDVESQPDLQHGIFDITQSQNPFAAHSMVVVSYCTGDVHLGDQDTTYIIQDDRGSRQLTIRHRGQVNAMSALDWIHANFDAPRQIVVAGGSAGSIATPFYANLIAQHYRQARVIGFADDGGAFQGLVRPGVSSGPRNWGMPEVLQRHPGWERAIGPAIVDLNINAARTAANLELYHVDHAYDIAQRSRLAREGTLDPDVLSLLRSTNRAIHERVPAYRSFTLGGSHHQTLYTAMFHTYMTGRHRFRDWVAAIVAGDTVPTVDCDECRRSEFAYSATDVKIIERAIELLSAPGVWSAQDPLQAPCAQLGTGRYSLRCGLWAAIQELTGERSPLQHAPPAAWDVMYTVAERMAGAPVVNQVSQVELLRVYNNQPGMTLAEILAVLHESRDRVRGGAARDPEI